MQKLHIISPNWDNVDRATIFFPSFSSRALILAIIIVTPPRTDRKLVLSLLSHGDIRIKIYTPAVTRVEEWTNADTGVGAAMAAGSHELNGNCALFVHAAVSKGSRVAILGDSLIVEAPVTLKEGQRSIKGKAVRINLSPNRLVIPVIRPALNDFALL